MYYVVLLSKCGVETVFTCKNMNELVNIVRNNVVRDNGKCLIEKNSIECDKDYGDYVKRIVYSLQTVMYQDGVRVYRVKVREFIIVDGVSIQGNTEVLDLYILVSKRVIDSKKFSRWLYGNSLC